MMQTMETNLRARFRLFAGRFTCTSPIHDSGQLGEWTQGGDDANRLAKAWLGVVRRG
jgi:hypothetical protein